MKSNIKYITFLLLKVVRVLCHPEGRLYLHLMIAEKILQRQKQLLVSNSISSFKKWTRKIKIKINEQTDREEQKGLG